MGVDQDRTTHLLPLLINAYQHCSGGKNKNKNNNPECTLWSAACGEWGCPARALSHLPVLHGGVAEEHVDGKPIVRSDVSSSTQGVQALGEARRRGEGERE